MKIDVFAICFNEEFMLPHFIAHYKAMGANITIYDNLSTDLSKEIILAAGCNYIPYDSQGKIRDDLYLRIKNNCWKGSKADWCIVVDIDELLQVPKVLSGTIANTKGYDMVGPPPSRLGVFNKMYSKSAIFRPDKIQEINYRPGCHTCAAVGELIGSAEIVPLLHYKYISEQYVYERHKMYQSRLSDVNKQYNWGSEYLDPTKEKIKEKFVELRSQATLLNQLVPLSY